MKVLILGASGFIGFPVAQAFVRAGHQVIGQTRSEAKAKELAKAEIIPLVAIPQNPEEWVDALKDIDAVVDCAGGEIQTLGHLIFTTVSKYASTTRNPTSQETLGESAPKITFIHTSGAWVYSLGPNEWASEGRVPGYKVKLTEWRKGVEKEVLNSKDVNGIIIRPALLYGGSGSLSALWFEAASTGKPFTIAGYKDTRLLLVHADDLADLYLRAVEKAEIAKHQAFAGGNDFLESLTDIIDAVDKVSGKTGWKYVKPSNDFEEAVCASILLKPYLGRSLLSWTPRKAGFVDGIDQYYASWKASKE